PTSRCTAGSGGVRLRLTPPYGPQRSWTKAPSVSGDGDWPGGDELQLPVLRERPRQIELPREVVQTLGVVAARCAEAVLQEVGRRRLEVERCLHRRRLFLQAGQRNAID